MKSAQSSLWLLSIVVVALGYVFVDRPMLDETAQIDRDHERTRIDIDRNIALDRDAKSLAEELAALRSRMNSRVVSDDPVGVTATFIGEAMAVARRCHVRLTGVDGRPIASMAIPASTVKATDTVESAALLATPIEVTIEGTYAALITALRQISRQRVPVRVAVGSIERIADPRRDSEPLLDARIRVDILHRKTSGVIDASAP